jgi:hypothetical protein
MRKQAGDWKKSNPTNKPLAAFYHITMAENIAGAEGPR